MKRYQRSTYPQKPTHSLTNLIKYDIILNRSFDITLSIMDNTTQLEEPMTEIKTLKTKCGGQIKLTEQTLQHMLAHPEALKLLEEAASMVELPRGFIKVTLDFGRVIGQTACVKRRDLSIPMQFANRIGRNEPSHVVIQEPEDSQYFTLLAYQDKEGGWTLITSYIGKDAPREPHDRYFTNKRDGAEYAESVHFWTEHGLCYDQSWGPKYYSSWEMEVTRVDAQRHLESGRT